MRVNLASFLVLCTCMLFIEPTVALPKVRTFRGVSRYTGLYNEHIPTPPFPNPRDDPDFYAHRYTEEYISQGLLSERPDWANTFIERVKTVLDQIGWESWTLIKMVSPYFSQKDSLTESFGRLTFNKNGDEDFDRLRKDSSRYYLEEAENNVNASDLPHLPQDSGFDYRNDKVRGVNIGNWLLFELWMDSSLSNKLNSHAVNAPYPNAIIDEWTAGQYSDYNYASKVLRKHFDTWFTEQDVIDIKNAGLNHIRLPFPYWSFAEAKGPSAPYLTLNRFDKLIEACGWARTHGIKVWVDIHGVPGSQNGFDNSGRSGPIHWPNNPDYYTRTQYTFNRLATLFSQPEWKGTVTAVEAVNEPLATNSDAVKQLILKYYPWARNAAARPPNSTDYTTLLMVMHDGFLGPAYWENFFTGRATHRVLLDTHPYFVYTDAEKKMKDSRRLREMCAKESVFQRSQQFYPTIAGEWSVSGPNGDRSSDRNLPNGPVSFPDGPNYPYSYGYMNFMSYSFNVQRATYEKGSGWIFWAWKNANALDWSYQAGLQYGWIPQDAGAPSPFGDDPCANYR
jgi:glucan 1,3-beta-glucosidase